MTKEQVLEELHQIAQEMNLPFDNDNILTIWCRRNSGMPQKIADEIFPLYTRKGIECKKVSAIIDNNGNITHIKTNTTTTTNHYEFFLFLIHALLLHL